MKNALEKAHAGRMFILGKMAECLPAPRAEMSPFAPRITIITIHPDKIREVIGPGGKVIKKITEETGCQIDIEDTGEVRIASINMEGGKRAEELIRNITEDPEVGRVYQGKVRSVVNFGAFVEIVPGRDGLLHVSEIDWGRTEKRRGRAQRRRHGDGQGHRRGQGRQDQAVAPRAAPASPRATWAAASAAAVGGGREGGDRGSRSRPRPRRRR